MRSAPTRGALHDAALSCDPSRDGGPHDILLDGVALPGSHDPDDDPQGSRWAVRCMVIGLETHPTKGVEVTVGRHVPRGLTVVASGLFTSLRHVTFFTTPSSGLRFPWIRNKNDFASDLN